MAIARVVFVETSAQAAAVTGDAGTIVAVTGEAVGVLRKRDVPHLPIGELAQPRISAEQERSYTRVCVELLSSLERFIAARDERARRHDGFLVDQAYHATFSVSGAAIPLLLMRDAIRALEPETVAYFIDRIDSWFRGDGYTAPPWARALDALAADEGFALERLTAPSGGATIAFAPTRRRQFRRVPTAVRRVFVRRFGSRRGAGLRLLFAAAPKYDWLAVVDAVRGANVEWIDHAPLDPDRAWTFVLGSGFAPARADCARYAELFDEWEAAEVRRLEVDGVDFFPSLARNLRSIAALSPLLAEQCDTAAATALEKTRPHAVCTFSLAWLSGKRLARRAHDRGVPVVCYQHGGAYGTHQLVAHELMDWAYADHFLAYGDGVRPPVRPTFPVRAQFVPVGSAAIAAVRVRRPRLRRVTRVLWVGEFATHNSYAYSLGEDTTRHLLETDALMRLASAPALRVTFRPYPGQATTNDVVRALSGSSVAVDAVTPLHELVAAHDLVITDTHSGTVWNQVLGWGVPLVLYLDPEDLRLDPGFAADLDQACRWCKDVAALTATLEQLVSAPNELVAELQRVKTAPFLERYVLHHGDPVPRVISFLESLRD